MLLTAFVSVPTLLTIFTITASLEIAGRLRGGRGVFGWIAALPWERPMVLATGLAFVMLGFGGFGGLINMGYGMNAMVHNTSWVTAHFHLIFGGSVVIMYFAIAYEIWPRLTGREHASLAPLRLQLWLWFIGMMVMTLPWHWLGLQGQWRRVANFNYADPIIAGWGPWVIVSLVGGLVLLTSALLFVRNLAVLHRSPLPALQRPLYALAVHPPQRVPAALNGFGLWNVLVLVLMLLAYGFPIAQFVIEPSPSAIVHRVRLGARHGADHPQLRTCMCSISHGASGRPLPSWALCSAAVLLGVMVIPVVQGAQRRDRRLHRDLPRARHPARLARAASRLPTARRRRRCRRWSGRRTSCKFSPTPMPERAAQRCRRSASLATAKHGVSASPEYPHLAGQSGAAIYKQLNDYRTGSRTHPLMTDIAKALDEATIADVAAYYAAQPQRNPNPATLADAPAHRATRGARRSAPQYPTLRGMPSGRLRRPDRDTGACRAREGIPRPAAEALCLGRAAQ